jgi:phage tail sheath protein FI
MVTVSYPGVYIREIASGVRPIAGVSTSIAAFVGMTKRGPLREPTRILGVKQFEDLFSPDTSQGELPDQVRQFFLNGGEQCFVVRIAAGALEATANLVNEAGAVVLALRAREAGLDANSLRVAIDYATTAPERLFNLTVWREVFADDGTPVVEAPETFANLGMDPAAPRYVKSVIEGAPSRHIGLVTPNAANVTAASTLNAFSASARIVATAAADGAVAAAIAAANPGGGTTGLFRIRVGGSPWLTIAVSSAAATLAAMQSAINAALAPHTPVTVTVAVPNDPGPIRITASAPRNDVVVDRAQQQDIAGFLGFGDGQGGIEVGSHAAARPAASGLVSRLDGVLGSGDLAAIRGFANATKAGLANLGVAVVRPFTLATAVAYPSAAGVMSAGTRSPNPSFANVRENLAAIASALGTASPNWRAEVQGTRLALIPTFGDASAGSGATFTSASPDLSAAGGIFAGVTGRRAGEALAGGSDGNMPQTADYAAAFDAIDRKVDLFNILVLPRSAADTGTPRVLDAQWGPASVFCHRKRAFLIADPDPTGLATPDQVVGRVRELRAGIVKDHSAVYWPLLTVPQNGGRKTIAASGSVAGVYARTDGNRGVWKAPAGLEADLRNVVGVATPMSDLENGVLNPVAVNAIRSFNGTIAIWGARTNDGVDNSGSDYNYIPVRRFALFLEESLYRGLQWAVFEPNDEPLWAQMRTAIGAFMNTLFRRGAFAGQTTRDAYFVKVDSETTTQNDINLGIVNALIGFAPLKPAEFIIVTLQQKAGQVQV